jgi:rod shape-determining protein MreD
VKKFLFYLFLAYIALALQSLFFKGTKPDLVLVLVCIYSLRAGQTKGIAYGIVTGLLVDTAGGLILGPHILSKSVAAFLIRALRENLFQWNIYINTLMIAILSVIDIILVYTCFEFFSKVSFANRPWLIPITQVFYTAASSIILYVFLKPGIDDTLVKEEGF